MRADGRFPYGVLGIREAKVMKSPLCKSPFSISRSIEQIMAQSGHKIDAKAENWQNLPEYVGLFMSTLSGSASVK